MPRPVVGDAADPITLEPVDEVAVTILVDNSYDALLTDDGRPTGGASRPRRRSP
jgi:7,8-dihydropterin-6-yl-methyl-4-(beta-D-ribofuranosyl)aminobenzene 5'-phosphate synthase